MIFLYQVKWNIWKNSQSWSLFSYLDIYFLRLSEEWYNNKNAPIFCLWSYLSLRHYLHKCQNWEIRTTFCFASSCQSWWACGHISSRICLHAPSTCLWSYLSLRYICINVQTAKLLQSFLVVLLYSCQSWAYNMWAYFHEDISYTSGMQGIGIDRSIISQITLFIYEISLRFDNGVVSLSPIHFGRLDF